MLKSKNSKKIRKTIKSLLRTVLLNIPEDATLETDTMIVDKDIASRTYAIKTIRIKSDSEPDYAAAIQVRYPFYVYAGLDNQIISGFVHEKTKDIDRLTIEAAAEYLYGNRLDGDKAYILAKQLQEVLNDLRNNNRT